MNILKKISKILAYCLLFLFVITGSYWVATFLLPKISHPKANKQAGTISVYLLSNGTHTDIVVPVNTPEVNWSKLMPYAHTKAADSTFNYLGIGWGDKGFYLEIPTWDDLTVRIAVRAAFGMGSTAIHATYLKNLTTNENCVQLKLTTEEYAHLIAYIKSSLQFSTDGKTIPIKTNANYDLYDAFYEAKGSYSIFKTCNQWTNNALKSCGQKACFWTAFDEGLFDQYQ